MSSDVPFLLILISRELLASNAMCSIRYAASNSLTTRNDENKNVHGTGGLNSCAEKMCQVYGSYIRNIRFRNYALFIKNMPMNRLVL